LLEVSSVQVEVGYLAGALLRGASVLVVSSEGHLGLQVVAD